MINSKMTTKINDFIRSSCMIDEVLIVDSLYAKHKNSPKTVQGIECLLIYHSSRDGYNFCIIVWQFIVLTKKKCSLLS